MPVRIKKENSDNITDIESIIESSEDKETFFSPLYYSTLLAVNSSLDSRIKHRNGHAHRVGDLSYRIAKFLKLGHEECYIIKIAGLVHDIGKLFIDVEILNKSGKLTDEEMDMIQTHSLKGYNVCHRVELFNQIGLTEMVKHHHEKWNGTGYPDKISGKEIPLGSRIITIADSYDAMSNDRIYREKFTHQEALFEILRNSGTAYDPVIVKKLTDGYFSF